MRGSKRLRPDRANQWQLRVDAGRDPVTGRRRQRSKMFTGTSREADRELARMVAAYSAELVVPTVRVNAKKAPRRSLRGERRDAGPRLTRGRVSDQ